MRVETRKKVARLVVKFGGSSLSSPRRLSRAVETVRQTVEAGVQAAVVVSAMGRTTDDLLEATHAISSSNKSERVDDILSMGERTSARIFHTALSTQGLASKCFDPHDDDWPISTDDSFGDATPLLPICQQRIRRYILPCLEKGAVPVLPGFVGKTADGRITTMGRGGSDITAFVLARSLPAEESVLVTDSDGLMTADPKLVRNARPIQRISIQELVRIADSGTKFLKTKALQYLDDTFTVRIVSNTAPSLRSGGTTITGAFSSLFEAKLESTNPSTMITITGKHISQDPKIMKEILSKASGQKARILGLSANSDSLILYLSSQRGRLVEELHDSVLAHRETTAMAIRENLSMIRIAGFGLVEKPGLVASVAEPLRENSLNIYGIFTIASSIVLLVDWMQREKALHLARKALKGMTR